MELLGGEASSQHARCALQEMACHLSRPQHKHTSSSCSTLSEGQCSASTASDSSSTSLYVDAEVVLSSGYSTQESACASPPSFAQAIFTAGSLVFPPRDPYKRLKADSGHRRTCSADSRQQVAAMERHHADILAAQLFKQQPSEEPLEAACPVAERSHSATSASASAGLATPASKPSHRRARSMHSVTDIVSADKLLGRMGQLTMSASSPMLAELDAPASVPSPSPPPSSWQAAAGAEAASVVRHASRPPIARTTPYAGVGGVS